jgi:small G protein signaling modulator 1
LLSISFAYSLHNTIILLICICMEKSCDFFSHPYPHFNVFAASDAEFKERLIANVKKEVKQIMEESVTKKFVHEDSSTVVSLCGAVEACLSQGLRRRALGLFKTSSTTALLHKISSHCIEAAYVSQKVHEIEAADPSKRSSSSSDSIIKPPILTKKSSSNSVGGTSTTSANSNSSGQVVK